MIKLFRKLAANCVIMTVDYDTVNPDVVHVLFLYRNASYRMNRAINLSEFTNVWGGDHVLENVLESYLDEFLAEILTEFKDTEAAIDAAWDEFNEHMKDRLKKEAKSEASYR